ncbi:MULTISPECIES: phage tail tube protein [unclassified Dehalobacter]|uniref:phage tail tube protein n=1 Tax=unclassified Dehalobacter TaxID=2635733 RepID=UPI001046B604|nr:MULTISPECIES: phage tail tube protein [unclassified Dehalobacter]TCX51927.1 hypothetical protein C1I36_06310 [Dehalobacter sp. 14DCB1]TCX52987.1 hypothetical protein C1I38_07990 [Dehalobacter sp. 12DCB1]
MDRNRMSLREGRVFLDGEQIMDLVSCEVIFTPEVSESRTIGQKGKSRRWIGYDVTGTINEYRSTPWLKNAIKQYVSTGKTPKFTIVGMQDDPNSDYGAAYGKDVVTVEGVVLTGDIPLLQLDSEGEHVQSELEFGAANVISK